MCAATRRPLAGRSALGALATSRRCQLRAADARARAPGSIRAGAACSVITATGEESASHRARSLDALDAQNIAAIQTGETVWEAPCPSCLDGRLEILDVDWGENGERRVRLCCNRCADEDAVIEKLGLRDRDLLLSTAAASGNGTCGVRGGDGSSRSRSSSPSTSPAPSRCSASEDGALIPEGGDVMVYGDGGAGKTTLVGRPRASISPPATTGSGSRSPRPVRVLLIENEGPRPLFRAQAAAQARRLGRAAARRPPRVLEQPWGKFTFADASVARAARRRDRRTRDRRADRRAADPARDGRRPGRCRRSATSWTSSPTCASGRPAAHRRPRPPREQGRRRVGRVGGRRRHAAARRGRRQRPHDPVRPEGALGQRHGTGRR